MSVTLAFANTTAFLVFGEADAMGFATLAELSERLDELAAEPRVTGLVIRSDAAEAFVQDMDPDSFLALRGERLDALLAAGQTLFNRIADLPFPTVAAIHGACLGGAYELALACDWRVVSDSPLTRIGLPQTRAGLLPAWGGSTRLPELLGLQDALHVILSGKPHPSAGAKRSGLIDAAVPQERLFSHAPTWLAKGKRHRTHNPIVHNQAVAALVRVQAQKDLLRKTRGHYPAPEAALEVACAGVGRNRSQSLQAERETFLRLVSLPETLNLIRLHALRKRAESAGAAFGGERPIRLAAVIGAAGAEIAHCLGASGVETILNDPSPESLAEAMKSVSDLFADGVERRTVSRLDANRGLDRIHAACGEIPLGRCDLVIDATGDPAAFVSRCRPDAVIAVCPRGIPLREISASAPHPERLIGLGIHRSGTVELIRTDGTSPETIATAAAFVRRTGKLPVIVRDAPGSLVHRILTPYLAKAASLFEQGGDPGEIDAAMLAYGMSMGPLRLMDEIGLDVVLENSRTLAAVFPGRMEMPGVVEKLIADGHTGRKAGGGFYVHDHIPPAVNAEAISFQTGTEEAPSETQAMLAESLLSEAKLCLEEGLAETAGDIDLALVFGIGYPAFRGGVLPGHAPSEVTIPV